MTAIFTSSKDAPYTTRGDPETRGELAIKLLKYMSFLVFVALFGCFNLIGFGKITVGESINIILAISTIFSGLVGTATAYYFKMTG